MGGEMVSEVRSPQAAWEVSEGRYSAAKSDLQQPQAAVHQADAKLPARLPGERRLDGAVAADDLINVAGRQLRSTYAKFTVDKSCSRVCVEIIDAASGEVVRQIPSWVPEKANAALGQTQSGIRGTPDEAIQAHALVTPVTVQRLI